MTLEIQTEIRLRVKCDKCGAKTSGTLGVLTHAVEFQDAHEEALRSSQTKGWHRETWWDGEKNVVADFCPACSKVRGAETEVQLKKWVEGIGQDSKEKEQEIGQG